MAFENVNKLFNILAGVFKVDVSLINDNTSPENTSSWDSFNTLKLIFEIENGFNVTLPLEEVVTIKSVRDIKNLLTNKGVNFDS